MSRITEYIKLIPRGIPHSKEIAEAIINKVQLKWGHLPEDSKEEIMRRRFICSQCPFMSTNAKTSEEWKALKGSGYKTGRKDEHCAFCGCGLDMRTASLNSNCGIETWNSQHPERKMELKWTKFEK